ncbi:hypothetical protein, partial [Candidatus Binatus sp.]
ATIPMVRLAEYMEEVAKLLGETDHVHFVGLEEGSLQQVVTVEFEAVPKVEDRMTKAQRDEGPTEPIQAIKTINRMLREDNGVGLLGRKRGATIIKFPGRDEKPISLGVISQEGSLDGFVNVVGGDSDPCPVHLKSSDDGQTYLCDASRAIAKELAKHMFDVEIRAQGLGKWLRDDEGKWVLDRFRIRGFDILKDLPLTADVADLRNVPGSEWPNLKDPWHELERIRKGPDSNGHK